MKFHILATSFLTTLTSTPVTAFTPSISSSFSSSSSFSILRSSSSPTPPQLEDPTQTTTDALQQSQGQEPITEQQPTVTPINGWVPDASEPCYGLPGSLAPTGYFDPLGFARSGISLNEVKRNREAELMHGRVAMIASVGYLAGEAISGPFHIVGPANDQLQQMPLAAFVLLTAAIGTAEIKRAQIGWVEPDLTSWTKTLWKLRDTYYPGDVGFDPLNLKPTDPVAFRDIQTRELQNGRLAMIGVAGMCAQELVNHRTIFETFDFYSKVYNGIDPYSTCGDSIIC